jgi:tRNA pseudouridine55 synthase
MARRRKGRDVSGWLIVDKPVGLTSSAVVNRVRAALDAKKAGHAGTLDPAATGVLAVALGEATKTVPYVTDAEKAYRFTVGWGVETDTDDAEGRVVAESRVRPSREAIEAKLADFTGDIAQVPPLYSAVKVGGERAYKLAREGGSPELAARPLRVESLALVEMPDADHAVLEMVCGKGGYVRAIARDLGRALGTHGHVTALRRIWSGPFEPEDGVDWPTLEALDRDALEKRLLPVSAGLHDVVELTVPEVAARRLAAGNPAPVVAGDLDWGDEAWASLDGVPVAIGVYRGGMLHPTRVLHLDFRLDAGDAAAL